MEILPRRVWRKPLVVSDLRHADYTTNRSPCQAFISRGHKKNASSYHDALMGWLRSRIRKGKETPLHQKALRHPAPLPSYDG